MLPEDKNGIKLGAPGCKLDLGKTELSFAFDQFPRAMEAIARIGMYGCHTKGYGRMNWKEVEGGVQRYREAELRHQNAINRGEIIDPESGLPHCWHVAWNCLARLELTWVGLEIASSVHS